MVIERSSEDSIAEVMYKPKVTRGVAERTIRAWFTTGVKAVNLTKELKVKESYLMYIPFWRFVAQGLAVACGHSIYQEQTGNKLRNEFEELINEEYIWTKCACDTGQYGIKKLWLDKGGEIPYVPGTVAAMDASGSAIEANTEGKNAIKEQMKNDLAKRIETVTFEKLFILPKVFEIVYAPIWIFHYQYNTGHFTVLVDAVKGEVIGGTSPMDLTARTRLMIISFTVAALMIGSSLASLMHPGSELISNGFQFILLLTGIVLAMVAYPAFKEGNTTTSMGTMENIFHMRPSVRIPKELTDQDVLLHKTTTLSCPKCGHILKKPWGEVIARCENCSSLLDINSEKVEEVPYEIAQPNKFSDIAMSYKIPEYIPFWKFVCNIAVTDYLVSGNSESALPNIEGTRDYYICATDIPRYIAEPWEVDLTIRNPKLILNRESSTPTHLNLHHLFMNKKTARELTEFLYLRYEIEKPGVLQVLRYTFTIFSAEIVYIPYYKEGDKYLPGI